MNPKSLEARLRDENPFTGMHIDSLEPLTTLKERSACQKCGKSRMYFCYTCFIPVSQLANLIPKCHLPIKIDIIKHRREIDGKSTAAHAAVLAPEDVTLYTYPDVPNYECNGETVLLYPSTEAKTVMDLFKNSEISSTYVKEVLAELPSGHCVGTLMTKIIKTKISVIEPQQKIYHVVNLPIKRVVLIDSTWNQSKGIFTNETLRNLPKIVLQNRISQFWRHQGGSPRWYLSTIEAIHQLLLELHINAWGCDSNYKSDLTSTYPHHHTEHCQCQPYNGQYDNLLYFFKHMYEKIHTLYKHENMLAYKRPFT